MEKDKMNYRSISVPVKATQWNKPGDHEKVTEDNTYQIVTYYIEDKLSNPLPVEAGDWIVDFPNGELHVVRDVHFKQRFEHTDKYTMKELGYAARMAESGDCV